MYIYSTNYITYICAEEYIHNGQYENVGASFRFDLLCVIIILIDSIWECEGLALNPEKIRFHSLDQGLCGHNSRNIDDLALFPAVHTEAIPHN